MKKKKSESNDSSHHSEIHELLEIVEFLMATVKDINDKLDALSADVDRVAALVKGAATQAELDAIDASAKAIQDKVAAITA